LHPAAAAVHAAHVLLHFRWHPRPWLLFLSLVALVPAAALWAAALADSLGITHVLTCLPVPSTATSRPERLLLLDSFLTVTLVLPLLAVLSGLLATVSFDLQIASWEISARVRLSAPPWRMPQVVGAALLLLGAVLFLAMAGHLAADCVFGTDCVSG
jgi:hypothetical protein